VVIAAQRVQQEFPQCRITHIEQADLGEHPMTYLDEEAIILPVGGPRVQTRQCQGAMDTALARGALGATLTREPPLQSSEHVVERLSLLKSLARCVTGTLYRLHSTVQRYANRSDRLC
jgi:hypothetical protein